MLGTMSSWSVHGLIHRLRAPHDSCWTASASSFPCLHLATAGTCPFGYELPFLFAACSVEDHGHCLNLLLSNLCLPTVGKAVHQCTSLQSLYISCFFPSDFRLSMAGVAVPCFLLTNLRKKSPPNAYCSIPHKQITL